MQKNIQNEEDLNYYYYNPKTDADFAKIAEDVYGAGVRDNTYSEKVKLGKQYHLAGDLDE